LYKPSIRTIQNHPGLADCFLSEVTSEHVANFAAPIGTKGLSGKPLQPTSVNARLRVLRRLFHLAVEWKVIKGAPTINLVRGERHRERVLTADEEGRYLAAASPLLADISTLLVDRNASASAGKTSPGSMGDSERCS